MFNYENYDYESDLIDNDCFTVTWLSNLQDKNFEVDEYVTPIELYFKLTQPIVTRHKETAPCFIGGTCKISRQTKKRETEKRQLLVLDSDHPKDGFLERVNDALREGDFAQGVQYMVYSTYSATQEQPRYRIVIILDKEIDDAETYRKIARTVMGYIAPDDITAIPTEREFDWSSDQMNRPMFLPAKPTKNSFFYSDWIQGENLDTNSVLLWYDFMGTDYDTVNSSNNAGKKLRKTEPCAFKYSSFDYTDYAEDPREKDSCVGSFCQAYTVTEAIETFGLPYSQAGGRWIYDDSESGIPGVFISDDEQYLYSMHESDPASGNLQNVFDLVKIHLLGWDKTKYTRLKNAVEKQFKNNEIDKEEKELELARIKKEEAEETDRINKEMYKLIFNDKIAGPIERKRYGKHKHKRDKD